LEPGSGVIQDHRSWYHSKACLTPMVPY